MLKEVNHNTNRLEMTAVTLKLDDAGSNLTEASNALRLQVHHSDESQLIRNLDSMSPIDYLQPHYIKTVHTMSSQLD